MIDDLAQATAALRESEERFRQLAETINVVFWMTPPDKNQMLYVSPAFEQIWGRPCEALYESPLLWLEAIHPDDRERVRTAALTRQADSEYDEEYRIVRPDGGVRWIRDRAFPLRDGRGLVYRIVGLAEDITLRKTAELELAELRAQLEDRVSVRTAELALARDAIERAEAGRRALLEAMPDRMYRLRRDGTFLDFHLPPGTRSSVPVEGFIGSNIGDLPISPEERETHLAMVRRAIDEPQAEPLLYCFPGHDGRRHFEARLVKSGPDEVVLILRDITERLRAERERELLEQQLRQAQKMEAVGTLAGGIAHDFNNILTAILGHASLLETRLAGSPDTHESLGRIVQAGYRARDLIHQILAFSRPQDQQRQIVRLQATVEEVQKLLRAAIPSTIRFETRIDPDTPPVLADTTQIHQVLVNLATNAVAAVPSTGGVIELVCEPRALDAEEAARYPGLHAGPHVCLTVRDNGRGIGPELRERIFEPFFTTRGDGGGTGLGLAVVHGIVRSHDGVISVESSPGAGTRFVIHLPACAPQSGPPEPESVPPPPGRNQRILVVDDEEAVAELVQLLLTPRGYAVTSFHSPQDALDHLRGGEAIDLLLTDLTMPGMSGLELARRLRERQPNLPVVVMTGFGGTRRDDPASDLSSAEWLAKPFTTDNLVHSIQRALALAAR